MARDAVRCDLCKEVVSGDFASVTVTDGVTGIVISSWDVCGACARMEFPRFMADAARSLYDPRHSPAEIK